MAVAVRSFSSLNGAFGANTQTVPAPSGATSGDLLIAVVMVAKEGTTAPTFPSGWAQAGAIAGGTRGGANGSSAVFWKAAGASEASYSVTTPATANTSIWCLTGADLVAPSVTPTFTTGATATMTTSSLTIPANGIGLVVHSVLNGAAVTFSTPTGYTRTVVVRSGNYLSSAYSHATATSATTGAASLTTSPTADTTTTPWQTVALAVSPVAAAPVAPRSTSQFVPFFDFI